MKRRTLDIIAVVAVFAASATAALLATCWIACAVVYVIFAPDRLPSYELKNNAGARITVETAGASVVVAPGETCRLGHDPRSLMPFKVETANGDCRKYSWVPVDDRRFCFYDRVFFQLQGDGKVYILMPGPAGPKDGIPEQPPGYPLEPQP